MIELDTSLIGLLAFFSKGVEKTSEVLESHSQEELFMLHGMLNIKSIGYWYKKYGQKVNGLYHAGSFVISDVQRYIDDRIIQIHFIPFDSPSKSDELRVVNETMFLALTDADKMFSVIEKIHKERGVNQIFGQTKDMALIAQNFGFDIRNNKINQYNNIFSTQDIPNFLNNARQKLETLKPRILERLADHGVTEKSARIDAILYYMGKKR